MGNLSFVYVPQERYSKPTGCFGQEALLTLTVFSECLIMKPRTKWVCKRSSLFLQSAILLLRSSILELLFNQCLETSFYLRAPFRMFSGEVQRLPDVNPEVSVVIAALISEIASSSSSGCCDNDRHERRILVIASWSHFRNCMLFFLEKVFQHSTEQ